LTNKDEVKANEYLFFGAADAIMNLLQVPKAILKTYKGYPSIDIINDEDSLTRQDANFTRRGDALISYFLSVPFPEELDDDTWMEKYRQIEWLAETGLLGIKKKNASS